MHNLLPMFLGQLDTPIYERLLDYGAIGILTIVGFALFARAEKRCRELEADLKAERASRTDEAKTYARDLRELAVAANAGNDRTADALEATGKSLDVIAVEYRRSNDQRGLPR